MRRLLLVLLVLLACAGRVWAQTTPIDTLVDMNTADANGTTLTAAILNAGTQGASGGWGGFTGTAADMTIEASTVAARCSATTLRGSGTAFAAGSTSRAIKYNGGHALTRWVLAAPYVTTGATASGWITLGPHDAGGAGSLFDFAKFNSVPTSRTATFHLETTGADGKTYAVNLETNNGGSTTHSAYMSTTQGTRFFVSLHLNTAVANDVSAKVYDTSCALVTTFTTSMDVTNSTLTGLYLGNDEAGTDPGTSTIFEDWVVDWLYAPQPLANVALTNYWLPKWNGGGGVAADTTCTVTGVNVAAADIVFLLAKWEGGAGGTLSASDGTSTFALHTADINSGSDPHGAMFLLPAAVATGTPTYTIQIGASRTFRDCVVVAITKPAGTGAAGLDGDLLAGASGTGIAFAVGPVFPDGSNGVACVGYAEFGATLGSVHGIGGGNAIAYKTASGGNSAIYCSLYASSGMQSAATGTLTPSNSWVGIILMANAPGGASSGGAGRMLLLRVGK